MNIKPQAAIAGGLSDYLGRAPNPRQRLIAVLNEAKRKEDEAAKLLEQARDLRGRAERIKRGSPE